MNKLNVKALGLTLGIVWASGVFLIGLVSIIGYLCNKRGRSPQDFN